MYSIYKFENIINGKIYIGLTSTSLESRTKSHLKCVKNPKCLFHHALKKYGADKFKSEIIATANTLLEVQALEVHFIKFYDCCIQDGPDKGYNMTRGGDGFDSDTVRRNNFKRVADGIHPWAGQQGSELNRKNQLKLVSEGKHHWAGERGSAFATANLIKRTENGTNPWAGESGSAFSKANVIKLKAEGRFHSQINHTCPHCDKMGTGNTMLRWHFNNCRFKKTESVGDSH